jgi:signal transduction histidine kinase
MELVILGGEMEGTRFLLKGPTLTLGRRSDNDICLPIDPRISRSHARLTQQSEDVWLLEDLGSVNGTFVGQRRINTPAVLRPNDRFRMGRTWMTLEIKREDTAGTEALQSVRLDDTGDKPFHADSVVYSVAAGGDADAQREMSAPLRYLQVYQRVGQALRSTLDVVELGNTIMDAVMDSLPAERAFLLLLDPDSGDLAPRVARWRPDIETDAAQVAISRHMVNKAMQERLTIMTTDAMSDERFQGLASVHDLRIRSAVCAPLVHKNDVLGVIYLDSTSATHVFGEGDADLLASVATQASVAIVNAQLFTDLRNAYEDLQSAQEQLLRSQTLSTIGALAATVAHDMINIVTPLQPLIDLMLADADVDSESEEVVRRQTKRLAALAERLMSFSHVEKMRLKPANINTVATSTLSLLNTEFNHRRVRVCQHLEEGLPEVMVDETQMDRVFLNLCLNAVEALQETKNPELTIRTYQDQDEVVISFTDNGPGIPADTKQDIFDPFYSTKKTGTGLGLFSCQRIVQDDHGGVIEFESQPGINTTFTVRLPVMTIAAPSEQAISV